MMIKPTESMINAVRAFVPPPCSREAAVKIVERILTEVDKDYVTRWGWIRETIPREMLSTHGVIPWIQEMVQERAKYMGGTIEDVTKFEIEENTFRSGCDQVVLKWRLRRD